MRVFSCKSYCPCICSSGPSLRLFSPCPLKLEDAQHVSSKPAPVSRNLEVKLPDEKTEIVRTESDDGKVEIIRKSSLKKSPGLGSMEVEKERVKWKDNVGKELVQIREFEHSESGSSEENGDVRQACICVIQ